nr:uncharacterized protein LOC131774780 [Pocillopora verrucosa]
MLEHCGQNCSQTPSQCAYQFNETKLKENIHSQTCNATKFNLTSGEQHFVTKQICHCQGDQCHLICNKIQCTQTCRGRKTDSSKSTVTSPPSPSPGRALATSPSSSPSSVEQLADEYVSKFDEINITRENSIQEAVTVFEDFTLKIKNVTNVKTDVEEVKTLKASIFEVVEAVEKFALNYSKRHLSGMRPSKRIVSSKMGELAALNPVYFQSLFLCYLLIC